MSVVEAIAHEWRLRLQADYPGQEQATYEGVVHWLVGDDPTRFDDASEEDLHIAQRAIAYRYRILQQRYWGVGPEQAYRHLIKRLSSLFLIRSKVQTWIALSRDRRRTVVDVLQEVIQEMLQSDRHLARQLAWITQGTENARLRNLLTLASIEEYCLRPIRNQPLIVYRFVNYLKRTQKGGMTQVPTGELIRLVSEEITGGDEGEGSLSLLDIDALNAYEEEQDLLEQQIQREQVKRTFMAYLAKSLDEDAARWLDLHLKGYSQDAIADRLNLPIQQIYRLREKVSYHAIRVFTIKERPDLVVGWLKTSLKEHNFGLTLSQWHTFWEQLSPEHQRLLAEFKAGKSVDAIAQLMKMKPKQVQAQWAKLYLEAQALRT